MWTYSGAIFKGKKHKLACSEKNLLQCHFFHFRSHTEWPGIEPGPLWWESVKLAACMGSVFTWAPCIRPIVQQMERQAQCTHFRFSLSFLRCLRLGQQRTRRWRHHVPNVVAGISIFCVASITQTRVRLISFLVTVRVHTWKAKGLLDLQGYTCHSELKYL
jgi:hypothetical protein